MNFDTNLEELYEKLRATKTAVLATSANNRPTARMMSLIFIERKIYFQTDKNFIKVEQITQNPYVALCFDNVQIEGIAKALGHPLEEQNLFLQWLLKRLIRIHLRRIQPFPVKY